MRPVTILVSSLSYIYNCTGFRRQNGIFLQSNQLSREQNDDKHTILNLVSLAQIKVDLGDKASARADLLEARELARVRGMQISVAEIDEKIQYLSQNRTNTTKPDVKYAETTDTGKKVFQ